MAACNSLKTTIINIKNIGVSKLNESYELKDMPEDFLLNTNYKGDKPGGLVIVIGENNTGKSNIKQALQKFMYEFESYNDKCRVFNSNDLPNYIDYDSCEPSLEFVIKDYKTGGVNTSTTLASIEQKDLGVLLSFCNDKEKFKSEIKLYAATIKRNQDVDKILVNNILNLVSHEKNSDELKKYLQQLRDLEADSKNKHSAYTYDEYHDKCVKEIKDSALKVIKKIQSFLNDWNVRNRFDYDITNDINYRDQLSGIKGRLQREQVFHRILKDYNELYKFAQKVANAYNQKVANAYNQYFLPCLNIDEMSEILQQLSDANTTTKNEKDKELTFTLEDYLDSKPETKIEYHTGLFIPKIIDYDNNHKFKNKDLITHPDNIEKSIFFNTLLNAINKTTSGIKSVYEKANSTPGYLTKSEEGLNKRIADVIADRFNKIYGKRDDDNYRFDMRLGKDEISLSIFKGNDV